MNGGDGIVKVMMTTMLPWWCFWDFLRILDRHHLWWLAGTAVWFQSATIKCLAWRFHNRDGTNQKIRNKARRRVLPRPWHQIIVTSASRSANNTRAWNEVRKACSICVFCLVESKESVVAMDRFHDDCAKWEEVGGKRHFCCFHSTVSHAAELLFRLSLSLSLSCFSLAAVASFLNCSSYSHSPNSPNFVINEKL
jgi:hypothetical protein